MNSIYTGDSLPAELDGDVNFPNSIFNTPTHPCEKRCLEEQQYNNAITETNLTDVIETLSISNTDDDKLSSDDDLVDIDILMNFGSDVVNEKLNKNVKMPKKKYPTSNKISLLSSLIKSWEYDRCSWDEYFSCIALLISARSPSKRLKVGSIIVKNNRIISAGYNGFPSGTPHISIIRDGHEQNTIHAEQNAIADAARRGVSIENSTIYATHKPCINCTKFIISAGIINIKYLEDYRNDELVDQLLNVSSIMIQKIS